MSNQGHGVGFAAREAAYRVVLDECRDVQRRRGRLSREDAMAFAIERLWRAFGGRPISWIGFYELTPGTEEMVLLAREPRPACSPIGLHGMCGRSMLAARAMVVRDVKTLGEGYIACFPEDQSEMVVPLIEDGACVAVLDVDSHEREAFDALDAQACSAVLETLGLSRPGEEQREVVVL